MNLFGLIVNQSKLHPNFKNIMDEKDDFARNVLSKWADTFVDRDGKFVKEFQTTFNSSFWELYLHAILKELGFDINFKHQRPDFLVSNKFITFCIEASIANNAVNSLSEWDANYNSDDFRNINKDEVVNVATIRLANTLTAKYKKYMSEYFTLPHVKDRPFVIAIAPFEQPFSYVQNDQAMSRVLYAFDTLIYDDFPERNERIVKGRKYMKYISKPNGAKIPLGFFVKPEMKEVSAIIFSNTATFGKVRALSDDLGDLFFESIKYNEKGLKPKHTVLPKCEYKESLLDGLHIFHNPFATHPISFKYFDRNEITYHDFNFRDGMPMIKTNDGTLLQRSVFKLINLSQDERERIYKHMEEINTELAEENPDSEKHLNIRDNFGKLLFSTG